MIINNPGSDWIIKLGPITRTNHATSKAQAESGARQMVLDDAKEILEKAKVLVPLLQKGSVCAGGTSEPNVEEEGVDSHGMHIDNANFEKVNVAVEKWLNPGKS